MANLELSVGVDPNYPTADAVTYPPSNYNIEIKFNPNNRYAQTNVDVPREYRLWIHCQDGNEDENDLSYLVGRGVFTLWEDEELFKNLGIAVEGAIFWNDGVKLCSGALYFKLTGQRPEQAFPKLNPATHA